MTITITLPDADDLAPLYKRYPGQTGPQPAYIEIDEDGEVTADWSGEIGNGVPERVWHNRTLRYSVPAEISGSGLHALIGRVTPLLERVHAGHSIEWDGSNHVGRLDDDAREASVAIERECEAIDDYDLTQVWEVADWLQNTALNNLWGPTQTLEQAATEIESDALTDRVLLIGDVAECLLERAERELERGGTIAGSDDELQP